MNNKLRKAIYLIASAFMMYAMVFNSLYAGPEPGVVHAISTSPVAPAPTPAPSPQSGEVEVTEAGDPDTPGESFVIDEGLINDVLSESHALAAFPTEQLKYKNARRMAFAMLDYALELANHYPPVTRKSNPGQIQKFVGLFNFRSNDTPFCAMGVAYAAAKAYCDLTPERISYSKRNHTQTFQTVLPIIKKYYFTPSPSCWFMMKEAMKRRPTQRGGWVAKGTRTPKRGWLVLFDWRNKGDGVPDHVGIVNGVGGRGEDVLYTVEFNTSIVFGNQRNGGAVAQKVRNMADVLGFIRTY
jgi:hypothetical protein